MTLHLLWRNTHTQTHTHTHSHTHTQTHTHTHTHTQFLHFDTLKKICFSKVMNKYNNRDRHFNWIAIHLWVSELCLQKMYSYIQKIGTFLPMIRVELDWICVLSSYILGKLFSQIIPLLEPCSFQCIKIISGYKVHYVFNLKLKFCNKINSSFIKKEKQSLIWYRLTKQFDKKS